MYCLCTLYRFHCVYFLCNSRRKHILRTYHPCFATWWPRVCGCNQSTQRKMSRSLFFSDFTVYPVGWPRVLNSRGATSGPPVKLLGHRAKDLLFELRERSLAVWHSRVSRRSWWSHHACVSHHDHGVVILHSFTYCWRYKLSHGGVCKHGVNTNAALKPCRWHLCGCLCEWKFTHLCLIMILFRQS